MKQNLGLSYKKGSSRPLKYESNKSKLVKKLFAIEFSNILRSDYLFINIDEVLFSNKTKHSFSWMPKVKSSKIENITFKGSKSLITAVTSNGDWFYSRLSSTNNSETFVSFMERILKWVVVDLGYELKKSVIMLDNLKVYKSKMTINYLKKTDAMYVFIPAYTPEIAPIELIFGILNRRIIKQTKNRGIKLYSSDGDREIRECFSTINKSEII